MTINSNIESIRQDFPLLSSEFDGNQLIYFDNAATSQKPLSVIQAIDNFYSSSYGTVHRGMYALSVGSTNRYNAVRDQVAAFLNAQQSSEIVFTKGCTDAINLVANGYARHNLREGDEIIISEIEHHANFVPWQQLAKEKGLKIHFAPVNDKGELKLDVYESLLNERTALVAIAHISNVLGTIHPIKVLIEKAHSVGAKVLIDGAQAVPHVTIDVQDLDCDFYCFSAHKMYGPTGVGCLYAKYDLLELMIPYQLGGDMIETVTFEDTTYAKAPLKFEAGTPAIAQVIGLGAAISYLQSIGLETIAAYEHDLLQYATKKLSEIEGVTIIGQADNKASVLSFTMDCAHPHDIGTILDNEGIAIRAGHHCSQPTMIRFGIPATARASFCFYNTTQEIDRFVEAIQHVKDLME